MAIYWNTFGLSDLQKTEYEISYIMRPINGNGRLPLTQVPEKTIEVPKTSKSFKDAFFKVIYDMKKPLQ